MPTMVRGCVDVLSSSSVAIERRSLEFLVNTYPRPCPAGLLVFVRVLKLVS
jgi:hypothetical protein